MGDISAKRSLSLQKITKVSYRVFTLFLIYGTEVISPSEVMTPSLRVMQMRKKEKEKEVFMVGRCEDLVGLDEKREKA